MSNTQDPIKRAISEAIGFEWTDGYLQTVNASDLLRLAAVIAALQSTARQPQGDAREAAYASGEGISGAVDGPQFDYHFRLHINTYADKHPTLVVRQLAARLRAAWQAASTQASEPSAESTIQEALESELLESKLEEMLFENDPLPERDTTKPAEQQGLFRKFVVHRTDGSDRTGGKHHGCEYFVLDVDHDDHAKAALAAYAASVAATHPKLAADMRERYDLPSQTAAPARAVEPLTRAEIREAASAADEGQEDMELSIAFASEVVKMFCRKNGITTTTAAKEQP